MHIRCPLRVAIAALSIAVGASAARAQLSVIGSFPSSGGVSLGFDHTSGEVWVYGSFAASIQRYTSGGTLIGPIPRPGEAANDVDIEFTRVPMTLGATALPAGTPLFINGETGVAEVYALNKTTGAILATLVTSFGVSHVVGGAHHPSRGTLFLVQDRVPGGTAANRVAEVDAQTGAVIQTWQITATAPTFTVNFGDIDVAGNGNLIVASEDEVSLGEFTPTGAFVALHALPASVGGLSGIGIDGASCQVWTSSTSGLVSRLGAPSGNALCDPCVADVDDGSNTGTPDGAVDISDLLYYLGLFDAGNLAADLDDGSSTGTPDGAVDISDLLYFLARFDAGC